MLATLVTATALAGSNVSCPINKTNIDEIQKEIVFEYIPQKTKREQLLRVLDKGQDNYCRKAVIAYLQECQQAPCQGKENLEFWMLILGFQVSPSLAQEYLLKNVLRLPLDIFLSQLEKGDKQNYQQIVFVLLSQLVKNLRIDFGFVTQPVSFYGHSIVQVSKDFSDTFIGKRIPLIVIDRWLALLAKEGSLLEKEKYHLLNALYALNTSSYRQVFASRMIPLIKIKPRDWILSFRSEPGFIQMKLLHLLAKIKDPEITKELLWLSKNHQDFMIRSLANKTLDELVASLAQ